MKNVMMDQLEKNGTVTKAFESLSMLYNFVGLRVGLELGKVGEKWSNYELIGSNVRFFVVIHRISNNNFGLTVFATDRDIIGSFATKIDYEYVCSILNFKNK